MLEDYALGTADSREAARLGTWSWDLPHARMTWSPETYRIFGLPLEHEVTPDSLLNLVHPDDRDKMYSALRYAVEQKVPFTIEHRVALPNGAGKLVRQEIEVFLDAGGHVLRMIGAIHDITCTGEDQRELKRMVEELERGFERQKMELEKTNESLRQALSARTYERTR